MENSKGEYPKTKKWGDLKAKYIGEEGSPERQAFDEETQQELSEDIKTGRATPITEEDIRRK